MQQLDLFRTNEEELDEEKKKIFNSLSDAQFDEVQKLCYSMSELLSGASPKVAFCASSKLADDVIEVLAQMIEEGKDEVD